MRAMALKAFSVFRNLLSLEIRSVLYCELTTANPVMTPNDRALQTRLRTESDEKRTSNSEVSSQVNHIKVKKPM